MALVVAAPPAAPLQPQWAADGYAWAAPPPPCCAPSTQPAPAAGWAAPPAGCGWAEPAPAPAPAVQSGGAAARLPPPPAAGSDAASGIASPPESRSLCDGAERSSQRSDAGVSDETRSVVSSHVAEDEKALAVAPSVSGESSATRTDAWLECVSTPWARSVRVEEVTLDDELRAFHSLVSLTPEERAVRNALRGRVHQLVRAEWPEATAKVFGSLAYGLATFASNIDIVVEGADLSAAPVSSVLDRFQQQGYQVRELTEPQPGTARATLAAGDLVVDVLFVPEPRTEMRRAAALVKGALSRYAAARPVVYALRWILGQAQLGPQSPGGLSTYAVTLMVLGLCATLSPYHEAAANPGALMKEFLRYYGWMFNYDRETMTADGPVPRMHDGPCVSVADPIAPQLNNVAASCVRWRALRAMLQYSSIALGKWERSIDEQIKWNEYRGKTPLSSIIAHKELWKRTEAIESRPSHSPPPAPAPATPPRTGAVSPAASAASVVTSASKGSSS